MLALASDGSVGFTDEVRGAVAIGGPVLGSETAAYLTGPIETRDEPPMLRWRNAREGEDLVKFDVFGRWGGCYGTQPRWMHIVDDEALWVFRTDCFDAVEDVTMFLHLFREEEESDDTDYEEIVVPLRKPVFKSTLAEAPDGGLWYLTDAEGTDDDPDPRLGVRAVHRGPDGSIRAVSPLLADPEEIGFSEPEHVSYVFGTWGDSTGDGAYLAHFVGFAPGRGAYVSYVARIEPDGSVAWKTQTEWGWTAGWGADFADLAIDAHEGGVVAVIGPRWVREEMYLWKVTRDGRQPWGKGKRIFAGATNRRDEPAVVADLEIASDQRGGAVVARRLEETGEAFITRFAADASADWTFSSPCCTRWPVSSSGEFGLTADGRGGVWVLQRLHEATVQHLDAQGRPLFWVRYEWCEGRPSSDNMSFVTRPTDGGVAMEAGTDAAMDGGSDGDPDAAARDADGERPDGGARDAGARDAETGTESDAGPADAS